MQDLLLESVKYMILGMGIVYLLLLLIVFLTKLQSRIITKYFAKSSSVEPLQSVQIEKENIEDDKAVVAAIVAAVSAYRKGR